MIRFTLDEAILSLSLLRDQLAAIGTHMGDGIDELIFTAGEIRLKRGTKILKIPCVVVKR